MQGRNASRWLTPIGLGAVLGLTACGGGGGGGGDEGGGGGFGGGLTDPIVQVAGAFGTFSLTPEQANDFRSASYTPPATLPPTIKNKSHYFRIEFPFRVDRTSVFSTDPARAAFSFLTGNVTVTAKKGKHVRGLAMLNGIDAFGVDRKGDPGFPVDRTSSGRNMNLGYTGTDGVERDVLLYVADQDDDLSTLAVFDTQAGEIQSSTISEVRVRVKTVNGALIDGMWTITIGTSDAVPPQVVSVKAEKQFQETVPDPTYVGFPSSVPPLDPSQNDRLDVSANFGLSAGQIFQLGRRDAMGNFFSQPWLLVNYTDVKSPFLVEFSEAMVPESVGRSVALNGTPFSGNIPLAPFSRPFPHVILTSTVQLGGGTPLFIPYDVNPINSNNLTTYRLTPIVDMPPNAADPFTDPTALQNARGRVRVHSNTTNATINNPDGSSFDLALNKYDGQNSNTLSFDWDVLLGPGPAIVNVPVSPEVVYWVPSRGRGMGAIDLNGMGFTTNAPGANLGDLSRAPLITKVPLTNGAAIGHLGHPPGTSHDQYVYPIGTGSTRYGRPGSLNTPPDSFPGTPGWEDPADPGNPATPFPGVNEMSSGFETLCRDSAGSVILTGLEFSEVGVVEDVVVGEFLDTVFFDEENFFTNSSFRGGGFSLFPTPAPVNLISDPPFPNPPPARYWVGLSPVSISIDQADPQNPAFLIEGEEVFRALSPFSSLNITSWIYLQQNPTNPLGPDQTIFPHFNNGPGVQSSTILSNFTSRQQIGNFLYVTDVENKLLHAVNSNTMKVISSINLPDPTGIGIAPDNSFVFVSNSANDSLSVVGTDPTSPDFHREIGRIQVGRGPRSVSVQPDFEDIFVCNFQGNTISIVDPKSLTVRKELDALISGPFEVVLTARQQPQTAPHPFGFSSGIYFGYISNFRGNAVTIYESGPDGPQGIGLDNIRGSIPTGDQQAEIFEPRGMCYSPYPNAQGFLAGGVFVAHRDSLGNGTVSHLQFTQQPVFGPIPLNIPPGFFVPPGFNERVFEVVGIWGNTPNNRLAGTSPTTVALADLNTTNYRQKPANFPNFSSFAPALNAERTGIYNSHHHFRQAPNGASIAYLPDRLYVGFQDVGTVQVLDPAAAGVVLNTLEDNALGVKRLGTYWQQ